MNRFNRAGFCRQLNHALVYCGNNYYFAIILALNHDAITIITEILPIYYLPATLEDEYWASETDRSAEAGPRLALSNEVNRITAGIRLAAAQSTKSLLTGKSVSAFDVHLISEEGRPHWKRDGAPG